MSAGGRMRAPEKEGVVHTDASCSGLSRKPSASHKALPLRRPGDSSSACPPRGTPEGLGRGLRGRGEHCRPHVTLSAWPGALCRPVSCEQSRKESGLTRPGDGWKLLLGNPSHQQEQGKCHHQLPTEGAPRPGSAGWCGGRGQTPPSIPFSQALCRPGPSSSSGQTGGQQGPSGLRGLALVTGHLGSPVSSSPDALESHPVQTLGHLLPTSRGLVISSLGRWGGRLFPMARPCQEALRGWLQGGPGVTSSMGLWATLPASPNTRVR